jgi:hypothetical protein
MEGQQHEPSSPERTHVNVIQRNVRKSPRTYPPDYPLSAKEERYAKKLSRGPSLAKMEEEEGEEEETDNEAVTIVSETQLVAPRRLIFTPPSKEQIEEADKSGLFTLTEDTFNVVAECSRSVRVFCEQYVRTTKARRHLLRRWKAVEKTGTPLDFYSSLDTPNKCAFLSFVHERFAKKSHSLVEVELFFELFRYLVNNGTPTLDGRELVFADVDHPDRELVYGWTKISPEMRRACIRAFHMFQWPLLFRNELLVSMHGWD